MRGASLEASSLSFTVSPINHSGCSCSGGFCQAGQSRDDPGQQQKARRPKKNLIPDKSMDQSQNVIWSKHHLFNQEESRSSDNCLGRVKGREIGQKIGRKATAAAASQRHAGRERERGTLLLCQAGRNQREREGMNYGKGRVDMILEVALIVFVLCFRG